MSDAVNPLERPPQYAPVISGTIPVGAPFNIDVSLTKNHNATIQLPYQVYICAFDPYGNLVDQSQVQPGQAQLTPLNALPFSGNGVSRLTITAFSSIGGRYLHVIVHDTDYVHTTSLILRVVA